MLDVVRPKQLGKLLSRKVPPVKSMYFIFFYTHMFGFCSVSEPPMNEKRLLLVAPLLRERVLKHTVCGNQPFMMSERGLMHFPG